MSNPFTDPFYTGDICTPLSSYTPSEWKSFDTECCGEPDPILTCLEEIKECLVDEKDYETDKVRLCEELADGTLVNFIQIVDTVFDKKAGTKSVAVENLLPDMVTPYTIIDPVNVTGGEVKVDDGCDEFVVSGIKDSWSNL